MYNIILLFDVFLSILHASSSLFFRLPNEFNSFNNFNSPVSTMVTVGMFIVSNLSITSFSLYDKQLRFCILLASVPLFKKHKHF